MKKISRKQYDALRAAETAHPRGGLDRTVAGWYDQRKIAVYHGWKTVQSLVDRGLLALSDNRLKVFPTQLGSARAKAPFK